ncbi:COG7, partial [Symbiodinium sp. KB8]
VALLAVYVDGFAALAPSPALEGRWPEVCRVSDTEVEVLPWSLLREVVRFVLLRPMEDDAASLAPPSRALRPSEAVLAAESNATRLLALPSTWARRLETQRAAQLAVPWLACVDEANAAYWRSWDRLIDTFANTLKAKSAEAAATDSSGYDPNFLQEVMQLHAMLHDTLPAKFSSFQAEVLKQAGQLHSSQLESPFSRALKEKMKDPEVWCEQLGIPSLPALKAASDLMDGVGIGSFDSGRAVLPAASAALAAAETKVRGVVTRCCAEPVSNILRGYPEMQEWSREGPGDEVSHGPLQCITLVPEHLFSLIPQLEKSQESSQLQWLPAVLEAAVEVVVQKVLQIKQLTPAGVVQLCVDLDYLRKVPEALGNSGETSAEKSTGAAARLRELLETLEFLGAQLQRKRESAAQGAAFSEEPRPPGAARWPEKALRS